MPIVKYGYHRNYIRRRADHCQHRNHCSVTQRPEMQIGTTGPAPGYAPGKEYYDWGRITALEKFFKVKKPKSMNYIEWIEKLYEMEMEWEEEHQQPFPV